ncbi:RNA-directed DNA polymerase from mobile element jockey [Araneus ventricosus]|uniref:RNA-directed DNA polymerase from mobile element jockey n=1 Tax=Araneus ventricosus TaxID=182803 RepID=A0A4Y2TPT3_ARAVE|nr:RNA-directed DNA polymerase from mobile element jockey [Araneus ventricosus]
MEDCYCSPILNPGKNPRDPSSYRPISLLSSLSKIAEAVILKRLAEATEDQLIPFQFGFRKNLPTVQQLLRITEVIREGMDDGWDTGAVSLDIVKAFDRVWMDGLVYKLIELRVPGSIIRLIATYLSTRKALCHSSREFSLLGACNSCRNSSGIQGWTILVQGA